MSKLNKFFFYLVLFTINAFRYNWKLMFFSALIVGIPTALLAKNAWDIIPCLVGAYLASVYSEYIDYKKVKNAKD